jgi:MFS family permease
LAGWRGATSQGDLSDEEPLPRWGAFGYSNFRRFWLASVVRVFALQFRIIGIPWLLKVELGLSPGWVGIVALSAALPTIILSLPAGSLADRFDNRRMIILSNAFSGVAYLLLALLVVTDLVELWMVVIWSLVTGALAALVAPAQQAILPQLIDMRAITSAVALNGMVWNSMRIIGPAIAGIVIAVIGIGQAFFVTTAGYAIASVLLFLLKPKPRSFNPRAGGGGVMEGVRFIFGNRLFLAVIGLSFFTSVFGGSYQVLLVYFATDILGGGGFEFGLLEGAAGVGAILGTLSIIKIGAGRHRGFVIIGGAASFGVAVALFAASKFMPLSMAMLFVAGFSSGIYLNVGMTALQMEVPDELRGRVMGIWSMTWFLASIGGFFAGVAAELIGIATTVALGGLSVAGFAVLLFVLSSELRSLPSVDSQSPEGSAAG